MPVENTPPLDRRWIILIVSGGLIMATLIVGLLIHASFHRDICSEDVCQTPECVQAAAQILNYIDIDVNPCDNFYEFVCGNFIRTAEISEDMNEVSTNTILSDELQKQLKGALEEPVELEDIRPFRLLKTYYQACINTEAVERRGLKIVRDILKDIGGWPVLEDHSWDGKNLNWYYYLYKFKQLGLKTNYLIDLDVQYDFKNTSFHVLELDQPSFSLPRHFLVDDVQNEYVQEYRSYMVNVAVYLGANEFRATVELRDSLKFESKLAAISYSRDERQNISDFYNIMTIKELQDQYPSIPWLEYINNLIAPNYQVTSQERILVLVPEYIKRLEDLLHKTSIRDVINYLVWRVIASIVPYLTEDLREMEFKFQSATSGVVQRLPRWKECLQETYKSLPIALSALYVRRFFDDDVKTSAEEVVRYVKQEYSEALEKLSWMDKKTQKKAVVKADAIKDVIGYPEELLDDSKLEEIYKEVHIRPKEYLRAFLNISTLNDDFKFKQLRLLQSKSSWISHSRVAEVDALYTPLTNTIKIPAGILQGSYFNRKRPNYLNYGGIGFAVAHEITHAFDDTGRLFDKDGNLANWWDEKTEESYHKRTDCLIEQYSNYDVLEVNQTIDGVLTQGDNIADNGGVKHAYAAYLKWIKDNNHHEKKLPGLDYTTNQLFWISFALNQCSKQRPEYLKLKMSTNVHSPPEFRVIGPLSNSADFANDFDCDTDSSMYTGKTCIVW